MLEAAEQRENCPIEVTVIPGNPNCGEIADVLKAELAPGSSLLARLEVQGKLVVWDPADREAPPATLDGCYRE